MRIFKIIILIYTLMPFQANSQAQLSNSTRLFILELENIYKSHNKTEAIKNKSFKNSYGIIKKNSIYYVGAVVFVDKNFDVRHLEDMGILTGSKTGNIITLRIPISDFNNILKIKGIKYIDIDRGTAPDMDFSNKDMRVDSVHSGYNLPIPYFGKDVVIAVIDWGFDYRHPNFYDDNLENLRIKKVWDQYKSSGPAPIGYEYGTEYTGKNEIIEAEHDTFNHIGIGSHGTIVAGIAAGTGAGTQYNGVAPHSDLVFVSLYKGDASKIDAFNYVVDYAKSVNKPLVVNMSFGRNVGPNDGTDFPNQVIDILSEKGIIFVGSAGNRGDNPGGVGSSGPPFHLSYEFNSDTIGTIIGFGNNIPDMWGQTLNIWGSANSSFSVALSAYENTDSIIFTTPYYFTGAEPIVDTIIIINSDTFQIRLAAESSNMFNNRPTMMLEVKKTGNQNLAIKITSASSKVHVWNSLRKTDDYTNYGYPLSDRIGNEILEGFISGDNKYSMGEPGGVGKSVISVAAHRPERLISDSMFYGEIARFSSNGPTADERIKPDISAPGVAIASSFSSKDPLFGFNTATVNHNGINFPFRRASGTSMSAPAVTGIVALMLEVNPELTVDLARQILVNSARTDRNTAEIPPEGSTVWGFGKVNALKTLMKTYQSLNLTEAESELKNIIAFPNPAKNFVSVYFEDLKDQEIILKIINLTGKLIKIEKFKIESDIYLRTLELKDINQGLYLIEIKGDNFSKTEKLLLN